jgi:WS/DGAT/MGAT family acyltransferase
MTAEPINPLDLAFLLLERDATPMHMGAVAVFRPRRDIDAEQVIGLLRERTERIPLLRRRARFTSWSPTQARWEDHGNFSAANHIHRHHLPSPGGTAEFAELVSRVGAESLDLNSPLWELHLITGLDEERFAVLVKLHHALADGAAAVKLGMGFLDPSGGSRHTSPAEVAAAPANVALRQVLSRPGQLVENVLVSAQSALHGAGDSLGIASSVLGSARLRAPSPLAATNSPSRRVAMLRLPVRDVRRVRAHHGGTTHEVVLAVITGALHQWLGSRGHDLDELDLRALIPVSRRARNRKAQGYNQLSGYLCDLPVGDPEPLSRFRAIRAAMMHNKKAGPLRGPGAFPVLADWVHPVLHRVVTPTAGNFASLLFDTMITHVPLPNLALSLAGADLHELYPLAPLPSGHALSVGIAQHQDGLHVALNCDRTAVPDVEKLTEGIPQALDELLASTP